MEETADPVLQCRHLKKIYTEGPRQVEVLTDVLNQLSELEQDGPSQD